MGKESRHFQVRNVFCLAMFVLAISLVFIGQSIAQTKRFTSPPASKEYWNAFCNKNGRSVELGIHQPNLNYTRMAGPFNNEPEARNWVNRNCSTWRCDMYGRCIVGAANTTNTTNACPPGTIRDAGVFGQGSGRCVPIGR